MGRVLGRAFWGPRPQSRDDGIAAIVATLAGLRALDEQHFARWFEPGRSEQDALRREIGIDLESVGARVEQTEGSHVNELGYSFFAHNGSPGGTTALGFNCDFSVTSKWNLNRVIFGMPPEWEWELGRVREALDLVVRVWRPEKANVWNDDDVDLLIADL